MPNVIKLKYGSGVPKNGELVTGEIGLDLINKIIYSCDGNNNIVEMSRNMGEGGSIGWDQITGIPIEIENIINGNIPEYGTLDVLIAQVKANAVDIAALKSWEVTAKAQIIKLQFDVSNNATAIADNAQGIVNLNTTQGQQDLNIKANLDAITDLDTRVGENESDISYLLTQLDKELTGLVLAGTYSAAKNWITNVKSTAVGEDGKPLFTEDTPLNNYAGNAYAGFYFVVDEAGTLQNTGTPARADGEDAFIGDWLVSDGPHWLHFNFSQESTVWGTIGGTLSAQKDLQAVLDKKYDENSTISGGNYSV